MSFGGQAAIFSEASEASSGGGDEADEGVEKANPIEGEGAGISMGCGARAAALAPTKRNGCGDKCA